MFWGLIMEPQKRYTQTVKKSFHVSMAALDLCSCTDEPVQVMCGFENRKYLLCTLQKDGLVQCALDLNYDVGDEISFVTNGDSHVHLTGYLNDDVLDNLEEEGEEEEAAVVDELGNISNSNIVSGKRPKSMATNSDLERPAKKSKTMKLLEEVNSQEEDSDSDDSNVNLSDILAEEDSDEEGEEEEDDDSNVEEEEDDDDDEEVDEDEEEEVLEDEESEDEEMQETPKMNGIAKKKVQKEVPKKDAQKGKKQKETVTESPAKTKAEKRRERKLLQQQQKNNESAEVPKKKQVEGGVIIEEIKMGNGNVAKAGKTVNVYYEGRFKNNNKMFDSTNKGPGFKFRLGRQEVIKGWDVGLAGMKVGGKRRITCPPAMAYGQKGSPPTIPPNSTLVFEVELKGVN